MEVLTEVPNTGTKLRIDVDREFERPTGDSVLRIFGQTQDGEPVIDASYVETNATEATLIGRILRQSQAPLPQTVDSITQEVLAAFGSKLNARDAQQIAQMAVKAQWQTLAHSSGIGDWHEAERQVGDLAERFERASAKAGTPPYAGHGSNGETEPSKSGQRSGLASGR